LRRIVGILSGQWVSEMYLLIKIWLTKLLRQLYPGQLHSIRKNVHHAIFVLDLAKKEDLSRLVEEVTIIIKGNIPIRFGIVLLPEKGEVISEQLARIFYHLIDTYGRAIAMKFAEELLESFDPATVANRVKPLFVSVTDKATPLAGHEKKTLDELMSGESDIINNARSWASRLGVNPKEGAVIGNGNLFVKDDQWTHRVVGQLQEDTRILQRGVYEGEISDSDDILEYLFRPVPKRRNEYVFPADSADMKMINLVENLPENGIVYIHGLSGESPSVENSTIIWVIDDFDSFEGSELLKSAAAFMADHPHITIGLVHNPGSTTGPPYLSLLLYHLAKQGVFSDPAAVERFQQIIQEVDLSNHEASEPAAKLLGIKAESWRIPDSEDARKFWEAAKELVRSTGFEAGQKGLVINGRVGDMGDKANHRSLDRLKKAISLNLSILRLFSPMKLPRESYP